jgi:hypothetical protein
MKTKHPPGPAMTLGNMRELSVRSLDVSYWNHHQAVLSADRWPDDYRGASCGAHASGLVMRFFGPSCGSCGAQYARLRGPNRRFSSGWVQGVHVWLHHATLTGRLKLCT